MRSIWINCSTKGREAMTLQQRAASVIETLPDDLVSQVILFAEFLKSNGGSYSQEIRKTVDENGYVRKPGVLKQKMIMASDFDETPDCFKDYV